MNAFVLYIEDQSLNLLAFSRLAAAEGHMIACVADPASAWDKAVAMWPDLIVFDQSCLGPAESAQLIRRFKGDQRFYQVPIILLRAQDGGRDGIDDADLVLDKPLRIAELRRVLRHYLHQPEPLLTLPRRQPLAGVRTPALAYASH